MSTTQAERIAMMDRCRAAGMFPRWYVRLPKRFWTMAERRETAAWHAQVFGLRSVRRPGKGSRSIPVRYRLAQRLEDTMRDLRPKTHIRRQIIGRSTRLHMRQAAAVHRALGMFDLPWDKSVSLREPVT